MVQPVPTPPPVLPSVLPPGYPASLDHRQPRSLRWSVHGLDTVVLIRSLARHSISHSRECHLPAFILVYECSGWAFVHLPLPLFSPCSCSVPPRCWGSSERVKTDTGSLLLTKVALLLTKVARCWGSSERVKTDTGSLLLTKVARCWGSSERVKTDTGSLLLTKVARCWGSSERVKTDTGSLLLTKVARCWGSSERVKTDTGSLLLTKVARGCVFDLDI